MIVLLVLRDFGVGLGIDVAGRHTDRADKRDELGKGRQAHGMPRTRTYISVLCVWLVLH